MCAYDVKYLSSCLNNNKSRAYLEVYDSELMLVRATDFTDSTRAPFPRLVFSIVLQATEDVRTTEE